MKAPQTSKAPNRKRIMVLPGKRGGFGAMKPILRQLRDSSDFAHQLVVTDQHVSQRFGRTLADVEQEFDVAAAVDGAGRRHATDKLEGARRLLAQDGRCHSGTGAGHKRGLAARDWNGVPSTRGKDLASGRT